MKRQIIPESSPFSIEYGGAVHSSFGGLKSFHCPQVSAPPRTKRTSESSSGDSGLGHSLLSSNASSSQEQNFSQIQGQWGVLETPKSGSFKREGNNSRTPSSSSRFVFRHGMISPICEIPNSENHSFGQSSSAAGEVRNSTFNSPSEFFKHSSVTDFRFDGNQISELRSSGLIKIGSPETSSLETPKARRGLDRSLSELQSRETPGGRISSRTLSVHPLLATPPSLPAALTPTKLLPFSPTHGSCMGSGGDYLGGFTSLSTSTPVSTELFDSTQPPQPHHLSQPSVPGEAHLFPSSPMRRARVGEIPRTPTPIKRAMAAIESRRAFDTPTRLRDFQEIIERDPTLRKVQREMSRSLDPAINSNLTPSKVVKRELGSPGSLMVDRLQGPHSTPPPHKKTKSKDSFRPPNHTPQPMSNEWYKIVCGNTTPQRELTQRAKEVLGL